MLIFLFVLSFIINFLAITLALPTIADTYRRYARGKLVVCPENNQQATVAVSAKLAALTSILLPKELRTVKECSLWPAVNCRRACRFQLR